MTCFRHHVGQTGLVVDRWSGLELGADDVRETGEKPLKWVEYVIASFVCRDRGERLKNEVVVLIKMKK